MAVQHDQLSREVLRAIRGKRSQRAFSRRLRRSTNVAYAWETGRAFPTLATARQAALLNQSDVLSDFSRFSIQHVSIADDVELLRAVRGSLSNAEVARRMGKSTSQVSRWLSGNSEIRFPDVLQMVDVCTARLLDFVALFVAPGEVPCVAQSWARLEERRRIARELPWSHGVLRVLELSTYLDLERHSDAWIACQLGVDEQVVAVALRALVKAGLVKKRAGLYRATPMTVDMAGAPVAARNALKEHWLDVAHRHFPQRNADDIFSYNIVSVSLPDLEKLRQVHVEYFNAVRQIVSQSAQPTCVALLSMQLLRFPSVEGRVEREP